LMPVESIQIDVLKAPLDASMRPPGSKSITNRALVCAALAKGARLLSGALDSEDTQVMIDALQSLGVPVKVYPDGDVLLVEGCGGRIPNASADIYVSNSGTTVRFVSALLALG